MGQVGGQLHLWDVVGAYRLSLDRRGYDKTLRAKSRRHAQAIPEPRRRMGGALRILCQPALEDAREEHGLPDRLGGDGPDRRGRRHVQGSDRAAYEFLLERQASDGTWEEEEFTATGFPKHFMIKYHNYRNCFPLMALGKFLKQAKEKGLFGRYPEA